MDGKQDLFWTLVEPEHPRLRAFCRKLTGNRDDGDDLLQDSLVAGLSGFGELRDPGAWRPWLYRIAVNRYRDRLRRPWWKRLVRLSDEVSANLGGDDPDHRYAARRRLERAFRVLSPEERAMVTLFELEGWTIAELAELYEKREGGIKMRLLRARRKMRKALTARPLAENNTNSVETLEGRKSVCVATKHGKS
jgi:RNA polymerase sigma-70 factor (ECF subfamily)